MAARDERPAGDVGDTGETPVPPETAGDPSTGSGQAIAPALQGGAPLVGIVMGSASDRGKMQPAADILAQFGVPCEVVVLSAHRTPEETAEYARGAAARGLRILIGGAGWSAALPGVLAGHTTLPVIGVPLTGSPLGGQDALYSMIQMPPGVPVAVVGLDTARNAGLLAVRILALGDARLAAALEDYREKARQAVLSADAGASAPS
ncbi:MAG TPA: 5-(carboxyamino)imidazole ribonucleotide mutase [Armatimonadota bacterium]